MNTGAASLDVSVVLRTYTDARWQTLVKAIQSVREQTVPVTEIVLVIDNNPALYRKAKEQFPDVVVVPNRYKPGSATTWNMGIETAKGQIVAFIDDDAQAAPDWIENLLTQYANPQVVGVGGHIEPVWPDEKPGWFPEEFYWAIGCSYRGLLQAIEPVRNFIGCNMSFRRQALLDIGLFLTEHGLGHITDKPNGGDEVELCIRMSQEKPDAILLHNPQAVVHHSIAEARTRPQFFHMRCYLEGKSKATISHLSGFDTGLSAERRHAFKTLPKGILRNLWQVVTKWDVAGLVRAGAIVAGLACTTAGYITGSTNMYFSKHAEPREVLLPGSSFPSEI